MDMYIHCKMSLHGYPCLDINVDIHIWISVWISTFGYQCGYPHLDINVDIHTWISMRISTLGWRSEDWHSKIMNIHVDIRGIFKNPCMDILWILGPGRLHKTRLKLCNLLASASKRTTFCLCANNEYSSPRLNLKRTQVSPHLIYLQYTDRWTSCVAGWPTSLEASQR